MTMQRKLKLEHMEDGGLKIVLHYGTSSRFLSLTPEEKLELLELLKGELNE